MLEIKNLRKIYSSGKGLKGITTVIEKGSISAIVGPNGAGKSTLFNIFNGIVSEDGGECYVDGIEISELPLNKTGFLPEADFMIDSFSVIQMIEYMIYMKKLDVAENEVERLLLGFSMWENRNLKISALSQGMKKRIAIICAVIGYPKLIVLDEPLNALDIQSVIFMKTILAEAKNHGCYILISSHVLDFLDGLTDRIIFLKDGNIVFDSPYSGKKIEELYCDVFEIEKQI